MLVLSPVATLLARDMRALGMLIVGTLSLIGMVAPLDLGYGGLPGQRTSRTGQNYKNPYIKLIQCNL